MPRECAADPTSSIRRGGDVIKALCLGAKAVGIGRSFLYSLVYGTEGAEHLVEIIKDEVGLAGTLWLLGADKRPDGECDEAVGYHESVGGSSGSCQYVGC